MDMRPGEHPNNGNEAREATLRDRIRERLSTHGQLDATKIGVVVRRSEVLLWGSVASDFERDLAAAIAAEVGGRLHVMNHIHVFRTH